MLALSLLKIFNLALHTPFSISHNSHLRSRTKSTFSFQFVHSVRYFFFFFWPICDFVLDLLLSVLAQVFLSLSLPILQWLPLICSFSGLTLSFLSLKKIPNLISVSKIRDFSLRIVGCLGHLTYMVQIYKGNIIQISLGLLLYFCSFSKIYFLCFLCYKWIMYEQPFVQVT